MKIVYIGCVQSSAVFLEATLSVKNSEVVGIITKHQSKFNSDFVSLKNIAKENNIPCMLWENCKTEDIIAWVKKLNADVIYCFGWSHLLSMDLINSAPLGAIGYHPALLPKNRGRHPIVWALVLGLKETGSSFFFLDKDADKGDLLSQEKVKINDADTAATLYEKLLQVGINQVKDLTQKLLMGKFERIPQNSAVANSWRKRNYKDGIIDWRMTARGIYNLVRALTHPYVGASFICNEKEHKVWQADIVSENTIIENIEPGKVISVDKKGITVQCGQGSILLSNIFVDGINEGDYLL